MLLNAGLIHFCTRLEVPAVWTISVIYAFPVTAEGITDKRAVKYEEHLCLQKSRDIF